MVPPSGLARRPTRVVLTIPVRSSIAIFISGTFFCARAQSSSPAITLVSRWKCATAWRHRATSQGPERIRAHGPPVAPNALQSSSLELAPSSSLKLALSPNLELAPSSVLKPAPPSKLEPRLDSDPTRICQIPIVDPVRPCRIPPEPGRAGRIAPRPPELGLAPDEEPGLTFPLPADPGLDAPLPPNPPDSALFPADAGLGLTNFPGFLPVVCADFGSETVKNVGSCEDLDFAHGIVNFSGWWLGVVIVESKKKDKETKREKMNLERAMVVKRLDSTTDSKMVVYSRAAVD
ncbi:unnamed protein product [Rhizoctonia solani]|uniref:Uncharacterized protein n=1 Tax=Rhizoctonia solani TaxID=456999 RepID=A0A8H2WXN9_9AGAM|nr:unnamed protein product [Rhizoctonia solani]